MSWFGGKKKQAKKEFTGFPGDCSEQQIQTLQKFKKHVQQNKKVSLQHFDDVYLLRFLRARKFDLPKTIKMWDNFIDWRVKHDIDNYKNFKFPQLPELRKMYPHGYHKVDKKFRPIYIERVGFMDVTKIFKVMQTEDMLQYYALLYESLLTTIFDGCTKARQQATGQHNKVTQTITILDLKNVKLGNVSKAYDFIKPVSAMAQDNYPQILGNMFIVNAPMLFTGIWAIVKMWIDDKTKEKIKILGGSYKKQLLQHIDPKNLPAFLDGGECKCNGKQCVLEHNVGPWNPEGKDMFLENIIAGQQKLEQKKLFAQHQQQVTQGTQTQIEEKDKKPVTVEQKVQTIEQGTQTESPNISQQQKIAQTLKTQAIKIQEMTASLQIQQGKPSQ